ncbi:MAG: hypothetical protein RL077_335 [Verrucomicrobiota bacterium]|jgi:hypothetical protein
MNADLGWLLGKLAAGHAVLFVAVGYTNLTERARRRSYWRLRASRNQHGPEGRATFGADSGAL